MQIKINIYGIDEWSQYLENNFLASTKTKNTTAAPKNAETKKLYN